MADVATLGLQVESSSVRKGTADLNQLSGAAARAEAATNGLSGASQGASGAANAAAQAFAKEGAAAAQASKQIDMLNRAANQNTRGAAGRGNISNIAAQFQDIGVSAAGGMAAFQIALQQGTQLAAVISTMENPVRGLAEAFASVLSPVSLLIITFVAIAAEAIKLINWAKLAASALNSLADILVEIAPYAVGAAAAIALLYAPEIIGGIIGLIALLGRLATSALYVAAAFAAANPALAFVIGVTAAVAAANIFRDELTKILGVDIVDAAKRGANFIIGSFVAAYEDLKFIWNQFPNIIGSAAIGAANAAIGAIEQMLNGASNLLNGFIDKVNSALAELPGGLQIGKIGAVDFGKIENPYAKALSDAVGDRNSAVKDALSKDYLGDFGAGIAKGASAAAEKLKELAKGLTDVDAKAKKHTGKTEAEKYDDIIDGANRRIASLQAEQDALGLTEQAALKLRYETDLLNQAQQKGITLTDAQKSELSGLADRMASIEIATKNAREAMDFAKDSTRGFLDDLRTGLQNGEGLWKSFGNAALGVLDKIVSKINDQLVDAIFSASGAGSGGGGFWSSLLGIFGLAGGSSKSTAPGWLDNGFDMGFASGTPAARPGIAWVGEKGPELVRFKGGEEVIPNHRLRVPANQNAGAAKAGDIHIDATTTIDARGADSEAVARLQAAQARRDAELPSKIIETVKEAQRRRVLN